MRAKHFRRLPVALTIAGSDSGGGAGIQADLKVFTALGVHGTTAITCLTAQNPRRVTAIEPCTPEMVRAQLEAVFSALRPAAVKTGMLYASAIVQVVADWFRAHPDVPLVIDPVMVSTSGAMLLNERARRVLLEELLPLSCVVTPNLDEASSLIGAPLRSVEDLREAARVIQHQFGCAALVKGGHLRRHAQAVDIFFDGKTELLLTAPFIRGVSTHGTGCTYSAAITASLAKGSSLRRSVEIGKQFITSAVANSYRVGRDQALGISSEE